MCPETRARRGKDPGRSAHDSKRIALGEALQEGERSGIAEDYSLEVLLDELDAESD